MNRCGLPRSTRARRMFALPAIRTLSSPQLCAMVQEECVRRQLSQVFPRFQGRLRASFVVRGCRRPSRPLDRRFQTSDPGTSLLPDSITWASDLLVIPEVSNEVSTRDLRSEISDPTTVVPATPCYTQPKCSRKPWQRVLS